MADVLTMSTYFCERCEHIHSCPKEKVIEATPFCCPVCYGNGLRPLGFYNSDASGRWTSADIGFEPCRSCRGTGFVWESK